MILRKSLVIYQRFHPNIPGHHLMNTRTLKGIVVKLKMKFLNPQRAIEIFQRSLAGDRSIVIKKADKGSCVVVWERLYYLMEAEKTT